MLDLALIAWINRRLDGAAWARERLAPFAGRRARLALGALCVDFRIATDGMLESLGAGEPEVEIQLFPPDPFELPAGREAWMKRARIAGAADFAEALGFVLRHLEWDVEEDLSRILGDIAAHRLAGTARQLAASAGRTARRLAGNLEEYLRYERPAGLRRDEMAALADDIGRLQRDIERLERRLAALEASVT